MAAADEVLVVRFAAPASPRWPVLAEVAPDVAVLRANAAELPQIAQHARLAMARVPGGIETLGDERALDQLDEGARLFVDSWRQQHHKGPRIGEGLDWDAPGFEPPDRPPQ